MNKKVVAAIALALGLSSFSMAADGSFSPDSIISGATGTITAIATGLGSLLLAAVAIYGSFLGYRKVREAMRGV